MKLHMSSFDAAAAAASHSPTARLLEPRDIQQPILIKRSHPTRVHGGCDCLAINTILDH